MAATLVDSTSIPWLLQQLQREFEQQQREFEALKLRCQEADEGISLESGDVPGDVSDDGHAGVVNKTFSKGVCLASSAEEQRLGSATTAGSSSLAAAPSALTSEWMDVADTACTFATGRVPSVDARVSTHSQAAAPQQPALQEKPTEKFNFRAIDLAQGWVKQDFFGAKDNYHRTPSQAVSTAAKFKTIEDMSLSFYMIHHWLFEGFCGMSIMINLVAITVQTQLAAQGDKVPFWDVLDQVMAFIFLFEIMIRLSVLKCQYFRGREWRWNMFDLFVVSATMWELVEIFLAQKVSRSVSILRVARMFKLVRLFRAIRVFRIFRELRMIMLSTIETLSTLFWGVLTLMLVIWVFSIIFVQAATIAKDQMRENSPFLDLGDTSLKLLQSVTGGVDWGEPHEDLKVADKWLGVVFVCYIMFVQMALLNVVGSMFVENAMRLAVKDHNVVIQDHLSNKASYLTHVRMVFQDADPDHDNRLSWSTFEAHMTDDNVKALLNEVDLDVSEVFGLFLLLDRDGNGFVDLDEFLSGCMRLKGPAKQVDLALLLLESTRITKKIAGLAQMMEKQFEMQRSETANIIHGANTQYGRKSSTQSSIKSGWFQRPPPPKYPADRPPKGTPASSSHGGGGCSSTTAGCSSMRAEGSIEEGS